MNLNEQIKDIFQCPFCSTSLFEKEQGFQCKLCNRLFRKDKKNQRVIFFETPSNAGKDISNIRDYFKIWPRFYYFIAKIFGPLWWSGVSSKNFTAMSNKKRVILNLGSGPKIINPTVVNVDMFSYQGVSVVADIHALPFRDNSVGTVLCDTVLEHVKKPQIVVKEINRVLSVDGLVYITVPFLYPFHSSPNDFYRWTHEGLSELMNDYEIIKIGVRAGPFSALTIWFCYIFASVFSFGYAPLYWLLMNLFLFIFFPIKLIDIIASRLPFAINLASVLYVIAKKKS